ncbi:MAG: hypothetical protein CL693_00230 [Cellvibrionaceae bacterium]|nr:hypothetical protein [Cellvibrionaceae bacterium]|tara:strand:+ start:4693 stop:5109 length:417 start_codon:yes stop_codon:yes gene_type:complete
MTKSNKRVLGAQSTSGNTDEESSRLTVRMSGIVLEGIKEDMEANEYSKKDRSKWICEAILEMWEQFSREPDEDKELYLKLTSPFKESMTSFDIYLSEKALTPFYKMVEFAESVGLNKDPKTRVSYMAISMRLIRRGRI